MLCQGPAFPVSSSGENVVLSRDSDANLFFTIVRTLKGTVNETDVWGEEPFPGGGA
jgi:hypothetical protein